MDLEPFTRGEGGPCREDDSDQPGDAGSAVEDIHRPTGDVHWSARDVLELHPFIGQIDLGDHRRRGRDAFGHRMDCGLDGQTSTTETVGVRHL